MKAIMIMYDSLCRELLPCYGGEIELPNFRRLAEKTAVFDNCYVGSLPCMPARREIHTGRPNLLHRSWGPIEPFDDSMPELLHQAGIHTHLTPDHFHYTQDGVATYHERYSTWEVFRGQENDKWKGSAQKHSPNEFAPALFGVERLREAIRGVRQQAGWQNLINRTQTSGEADYPQTLTFDAGMQFLAENVDKDDWFLQIETFDPHEPFDVPDSFNRRWFNPDAPSGPDWPPYAPVREGPAFVGDVRKRYYGLMQFCDKSLGRVLDFMDEHGMWQDTLLIVNTDHGFFNGEHNWWGKGPMPDYQELVHTPFFLWDPRCGAAGVHRTGLIQTIDIAPTLLDYFGVEIPADMTGKPLREVAASDAPVHEYALMGYFGSVMSITDGRYKLMRAVRDATLPIYEYTQMPTHMNKRFTIEEMRTAQPAGPFSFTKGTPVMKIQPDQVPYASKLTEDLLFDLQEDPHEEHPITDSGVSARLTAALAEAFRELDAPEELYARYGLSR